MIATIFNKVFPLLRLGEPVLRVIDLGLELEYYQKFNLKPTRRFQGKDGHEIDCRRPLLIKEKPLYLDSYEIDE